MANAADSPAPHPISRANRWLTAARFSALLAILTVAAFPDVVTGLRTFALRDFSYFGFPLASYHREAFWDGEVPLWNPLSNCGIPFLAQWNTLVLYPGSLLYLLLPLPWALNFFCLAHLNLGGIGMYLLAGRWSGSRLGAGVAGVTYTFNGLALNALMWPNNVAAFGWAPWVLLATERAWREGGRHFPKAALLASLQMLSGAPEVILLTWGLAGGWWMVSLVRSRGERLRRAKRFALLILFTTLLAAAQLLPFLKLLQESQRDTSFYEGAWSMPPTGWLNFLVPLFRCFSTPQGIYFQWDQYWTASYYLGIIPVLLGLVGAPRAARARALFLAGVALGAAWLALGHSGLLYSLVKSVLPQIGFMRYPVKFVVMVLFALPVLASLGMRRLVDGVRAGEARGARTLMSRAALLTGLVLAILWASHAHPGLKEDWKVTARSGSVSLAIAWGFVVAWSLLETRTSTRWVPMLVLVLCSLPAVDGLVYDPRKTLRVETSVFAPGLARMNPRPEPGRSRALVSYHAFQSFNRLSTSNLFNDVLVKRSGLFANCNLLEGIPKVDGFYSLYLRAVDTVTAPIYFQTNQPEAARVVLSPEGVSLTGLLDFLGVVQASHPESEIEWLPRPNPMPLVSAGQIPEYLPEAEALQRMFRPGFQPRRTVYLSSAEEPPDTREPFGSGNARLNRFGRHRLEIEVASENPVILVISQSSYPAWSASIDGVGAKLRKANLAFQALAVPSGRHTVTLRYVDWPFRIGLACSVAAGALLLCNLRGTSLGAGPAGEAGGRRDARSGIEPSG